VAMNALALFDFDGTLTKKDSLADFIHFAVGTRKMVAGAFMLSPVFAAYAVKLMHNGAAKQKVLQYFFANWKITDLTALADRYALHRIPAILRPGALEKIQWHLNHGHTVTVVSASPEIWLKAWTQSLGIALIGTRLEEDNGRFSGRYAGQNCHGSEKVRRIRERYDLHMFERIYAYGDTSGDKPMLALAHEAFYRPFR